MELSVHGHEFFKINMQEFTIFQGGGEIVRVCVLSKITDFSN